MRPQSPRTYQALTEPTSRLPPSSMRIRIHQAKGPQNHLLTSIHLFSCCCAQVLMECIKEVSPFFAGAPDASEAASSAQPPSTADGDLGRTEATEILPATGAPNAAVEDQQPPPPPPTPWRIFVSARSSCLELTPKQKVPLQPHSSSNQQGRDARPIGCVLIHSLHILSSPELPVAPSTANRGEAHSGSPSQPLPAASTPAGSSLAIVLHSAELMLGVGPRLMTSSAGAFGHSASNVSSTACSPGVPSLDGRASRDRGAGGASTASERAPMIVAGGAVQIRDSHFGDTPSPASQPMSAPHTPQRGPTTRTRTHAHPDVTPTPRATPSVMGGTEGLSEGVLLLERSRLISDGYEPAAFISRLSTEWCWRELGEDGTYGCGSRAPPNVNARGGGDGGNLDQPAGWQVTVTDDDLLVHTSARSTHALLQLLQGMGGNDAKAEGAPSASSGRGGVPAATVTADAISSQSGGYYGAGVPGVGPPDAAPEARQAGGLAAACDQSMSSAGHGVMDSGSSGGYFESPSCGQQGVVIIDSYEPGEEALPYQAPASHPSRLPDGTPVRPAPAPRVPAVDARASPLPSSDEATARWLLDAPIELIKDHVDPTVASPHDAPPLVVPPPAAPCCERTLLSNLQMRWALHDQPGGWASGVSSLPQTPSGETQFIDPDADAAAAAAAAAASASVELTVRGLTLRYERFGTPAASTATANSTGVTE